MLDFLDHIRWGQSYDFLMSGSPPIFAQLMVLNAVFMAIYAVRRAAGANPMPIMAALLVQIIVLGANLIVLYQDEVMTYLRSLSYRFFY